MVANELRRDGPNQFDNDNFAVIFDTFRDRRNGLHVPDESRSVPSTTS